MDLKILEISSEVFLLIISTIILIIQLLLCFKVSNKFIKIIPVILFTISTIIFSVLIFILDGWDSIGCLLLSIGSIFLIFVCGIGWLIWRFNMNLEKEKLKMRIYLILYIVFLIITFISAGYVIYNKGQVSAGLSIVSMLFGLIFIGLYTNTKKKMGDKK